METDITKLLNSLDDILKSIESNEMKFNDLNNDTQTQETSTLIDLYQNTKEKKYIEKLFELIEFTDKEIITKYITQKINDKTILEIALDEKIDINYGINTTIINNSELLKIVIAKKYENITLYMDEEDLLFEIDGMTLFEHLIKNDMFSKYKIYRFKKTPMIIDILLKYNKQDYLKALDEELLFCDYKGKKVIDFMFENNYIDEYMISSILKYPEIYNYIIKYKKLNYLNKINEKLLAQKIDDKYLLDLLLEENKTPKIINFDDKELIDLIEQRNRYDLLENVNKYTLMKNIPEENKSLFEFLLEKNIIPYRGINEIEYDYNNAEFFYTIISKHNKFELLVNAQEDTLLNTFGTNKTLLETLLEKGIEPKIKRYKNKESIDILLKLNNYDQLKKCSEEHLLIILPNGKMLIEELFERKIIPTAHIIDERIVKKIFELGAKEFYNSITTTALLNYYDLNTTYLEKILQDYKEEDNIDLSSLVGDAKNIYEKAKAYIAYAKYNKLMYLSNLTKEELLASNAQGVRMIDVLLELDPELTVNEIIKNNVKEEMEIAMILKLKGYEHKNIKFESITREIEEEYLDGERKKYETLTLNEEQEILLKKLYDVMNDGVTDLKLLDSLIASYRHLLATNNKYAYEIYHLIDIKKNNPSFSYTTIKDGAYFSPYKGYIAMSDSNMGTLNHETGHAIFHYLTDKNTPSEFAELVNKLSQDEQFLESTAEYSKKFTQLIESVSEEVEKTLMEKYDESITEEKKKEIQEYLDNLNKKEREKYIQMGYSEELLDRILNSSFTVDEYINQDRRIKKNKLVDLILRTQYGAFISIGDFLDGIYAGKLKGGILTDKDGNKIKGGYGHGIPYYSRGTSWIFDEMIANYSSIVKSENPLEGLQLLEKYIGKELTMFISEYYDKNILQSKKYFIESELYL